MQFLFCPFFLGFKNIFTTFLFSNILVLQNRIDCVVVVESGNVFLTAFFIISSLIVSTWLSVLKNVNICCYLLVGTYLVFKNLLAIRCNFCFILFLVVIDSTNGNKKMWCYQNLCLVPTYLSLSIQALMVVDVFFTYHLCPSCTVDCGSVCYRQRLHNFRFWITLTQH